MTPETSPQNPAPNGKFDPFSSAWIYPKDWNLSSLHDRALPASGEEQPWMAGPNPEERPGEPPEANNAQGMPESYEPFQDLRTFPSGWDLS